MIRLSFDRIVRRLFQERLPRVDLVLAVAEGGLVPGALAALRLGVPMGTVRVRFRDKGNREIYKAPRVFKRPVIPRGVRSVLIADDVSVTGKTLEAARALVPRTVKVRTLVLKGRADIVLFPEIRPCVNWPWNKLRS
ncbi:MAG: phosphoribosyltransferase [Candidatus Omnitrophica bacterium]|nr:phosphoribosyltransferase [Candidatus Omnitrophota bacterium]